MPLDKLIFFPNTFTRNSIHVPGFFASAKDILNTSDSVNDAILHEFFPRIILHQTKVGDIFFITVRGTTPILKL